MSWALGLWVGYAVLTILIFGAVWFGLSYMQKALLSDSNKEKE